MANLFERPIAAQPMSEFVQLPMDFIGRMMQQKQANYDKGVALASELEESWLGAKYLPGDAERHNQIVKQFDEELDAIVEASQGDYSRVNSDLQRLSRRVQREMTHGELAAQGRNYDIAQKFREAETKKYQDNKSSEEGYQMAMNSLGSFQTSRSPQGVYNTFKGYSASTIPQPIDILNKQGDELVEKFNSEGMGYRSVDDIRRSLMKYVDTDSNLVKSMQEKWTAAKARNPENTPSFDVYVGQLINQVAEDKSYLEKAKFSSQNGANKSTMSQVYMDIQVPTNLKGTFTYGSGSVPFLKSLAEGVGLGEGWKSHRDWANSEEGKRTIKYMEARSGSKYPATAAEQSDWLIDNYNQSMIGRLSTRGATPMEQSFIKDGQLQNPNSHVKNLKTGEPLSGDEVRAITGKKKDGDVLKTPFVSNVVEGVRGIHPPGSIIFVGNDGENYITEPRDKETLQSREYNEWLLNTAEHSPTGKASVTLENSIQGANTVLPKGSYTVEHMLPSDKIGDKTVEERIGRGGSIIKINPVGSSQETYYKVTQPNGLVRIIKI